MGFGGLKKMNYFRRKAVEIFSPIEGRAKPPLCLGRYRVGLLMGSKGKWFYKNLNSKEVKVLSCLGEGRMILDRKRIF